MKKLYVIGGLILCSLHVLAQDKHVTLSIHHLLSQDTCAVGINATNNLGNQFKLNRFQYYLDEIILMHDNGTVDSVSGVHLLEGFGSTTLDLGTVTMDSLESIRFAIGVNAGLNHLDPTQYPMQHPLAPKSPSMHWGWSSGYRFIAVEGNSGSTFNQTFEFHGLGDNNYAHLTLPTSGTHHTDSVHIDVVAQVENLFRNIDLTSGPVSHGETGDAHTALYNFNNHVFYSLEGNAAMQVEEIPVKSLELYPNPNAGRAMVRVESAGRLQVMNAAGQFMWARDVLAGEQELQFESAGLYVVWFTDGAGQMKMSKVHVE